MSSPPYVTLETVPGHLPHCLTLKIIDWSNIALKEVAVAVDVDVSIASIG